MGDASRMRVAALAPSFLAGSDDARPSPRLRMALPEYDWHTAVQQRHEYRCWVWVDGESWDVAAARSVAVEALSDWRLGPMADDVALCVSELVTNALVHAQPAVPSLSNQVCLGLRYFPTSCVFVEVGDCDPRPPLLPPVGYDPLNVLALLGGRGLLIVRELADMVWWQREEGGGKFVFARLNTRRYFGRQGEPWMTA
jgi:anti-sigma regulatory factor (Ser/Thr protein kinase)